MRDGLSTGSGGELAPAGCLSRTERFEMLITSIAVASIDNARAVAREAADGWWQALPGNRNTGSRSPPARSSCHCLRLISPRRLGPWRRSRHPVGRACH